MNFAISFVAIAALSCGLYGWGLQARRTIGLPFGTAPVTIGVGLALWIFIGGVLNVTRLAYPGVVFVLLFIGCFFTAKQLAATRSRIVRFWPRAREDRIYATVYFAVAAAIVVFAAFTQLAPTAFNHHDDYQKYFSHAARMVQTGTLAGSPLNTLGSETLGGQAFLQGLFVAIMPISYINAADAVFCFGLNVFLIGGLAVGRPNVGLLAIAGMLLVAFLEPQYVSVTALYSAATLVAVIIVLSLDRREYATDKAEAPPPVVLGLAYAAIVALKSTFALFVLLHFLCCFASEVFATRDFAATVKRAAVTAIWGVVFITPWIAVYGPLYWAAFSNPVVGLSQPPIPAEEVLNLFATAPLFYGGSFAQYSFVAAAALISGLAALLGYREKPRDAVRCATISVAVMATYLGMLIFAGPQLAGYETALRHAIPVLIGSTPALLIYGSLIAQSGSSASRQVVSWVCVSLAAIAVCWFLPDAWERTAGLLRTGSMLAYIRDWPPESTNALLSASQDILGPKGAEPVRALQLQVPQGEPLLAWHSTPFLLDYARNPIIDVDIGGLANPWSRPPPLSYVLWQYEGFGVRQPSDYNRQIEGPGRRETYLAARGMDFASELQDLATRSQIIASDGTTVLLRLPPNSGLR